MMADTDLMAPLQRSLGICPECGQKFTNKGAMASLTAMVQLHEALDCLGRKGIEQKGTE